MKKNFRKVMSVFLAMAIMLCTMSVIASAASFKYVYDKMYDEELGEYYSVWITGYEGTAPSKLVIPSTIEGIPVESIEPMAFMGATSIKEVIVPDTVYWIEDYAFAKCSNLAKVTLPGSLYLIDDGAFMNCKNLSSVIYTGYNYDYAFLYIGTDNDSLWENDWNWIHYQKDYDYSFREYSLTYKSEQYLEPDFELKDGQSVMWWSYDDCVFVDSEGYAYANAKGNTYIEYEIIDANGDVIFAGEDYVTVKYTFIQWIIEYILFGWVWGF